MQNSESPKSKIWVLVSGVGRAMLAKDSDAVRNFDEKGCYRDLVTGLLVQMVGERRTREVPAEKISLMASRIHRDVITLQTGECQSPTFIVTLTADGDSKWFRKIFELYAPEQIAIGALLLTSFIAPLYYVFGIVRL